MESILKLLPLDNLYKFMAMSGLAILLFSILYPDWRRHQLTRNLIELNGRSKENLIEQKFLLENINRLNAELSAQIKNSNTRANTAKVSRANSKLQTLDNRNSISFSDLTNMELATLFSSPNARSSMQFVIDNHKFFYNEFNGLDKFETLHIEHNKAEKDLHLKSNANDTINELLKLETERINDMQTLGWIGEVIGFISAILGFAGWYYRIQKPQDENLKLQLTKEKDN